MADKCQDGKVLTTSISVDACPVCEGSLHQIEITSKEGPKTVTSTKLLLAIASQLSEIGNMLVEATSNGG